MENKIKIFFEDDEDSLEKSFEKRSQEMRARMDSAFGSASGSGSQRQVILARIEHAWSVELNLSLALPVLSLRVLLIVIQIGDRLFSIRFFLSRSSLSVIHAQSCEFAELSELS